VSVVLEDPSVIVREICRQEVDHSFVHWVELSELRVRRRCCEAYLVAVLQASCFTGRCCGFYMRGRVEYIDMRPEQVSELHVKLDV
jgi:hypothetical protein